MIFCPKKKSTLYCRRLSGRRRISLQPLRLKQMQAEEVLDAIEKDAIGEIGNISMGSAATALSQLLNQRVNITTPAVTIMSPKDLLASLTSPFMLIEVGFLEGLEGSNLLILDAKDAAVIADLMMGGMVPM